MKHMWPSRSELAALNESLESLTHAVEGDLSRARELPEAQLAEAMRSSSRRSRVRAEALVKRIVELREIVESRVRTLERLRARMRQIRGGARPH